jgi:hypothetical protein
VTDEFTISFVDVDGDQVPLLTNSDDLIELDFVRQAMELRRTNEKAFGVLWDLLDVLTEAPPALEA